MTISNKPGRPVSEPTKPAMLRLTEAQRVKYLEIGGARWVKRLLDEEVKSNQIDKAKLPTIKEVDHE